jgi:hypothetical protein
MTLDSTFQPLNRLAGTWTTEATHPGMPGIVGRWQLSRDDGHWDDDLEITYRRR